MNLNTLFIIFLMLLPLSAHPSSIEGTIVIEKTIEGHIYMVGKRTMPSEALLNHFGRLVAEEGRNTDVTIYFDQEITFGVVMNLKGIINKTGISDIKYYYFNKGSRKAIELLIKGPASLIPELGENTHNQKLHPSAILRRMSLRLPEKTGHQVN